MTMRTMHKDRMRAVPNHGPKESKTNGVVAVVVTVVGLALVVLASAGCTMLYPCGAEEREYCVGDDCICGDRCSATDQDECSPHNEICVAYEFDPARGVCVEDEFWERHAGEVRVLDADGAE